MHKRVTAFAVCFALSVSTLWASGFSIYEQGAKASAMGGAFIAQANDISAVFFNPAGITAQEGFRLGLGTTIIVPKFAFQGPGNLDPNLYTPADDLVFPPSTLYATYQINDQFSAGFGFYTLFGLGSEWPDEWPGRTLATNSHVQTFFFNPVLAYKIMDGLSVAAGVSLVYATVTLERSIWYGPRNVWGESELDASTTGFGFNVGVQYKPIEGLTLGAVFRPNTLLEFTDGDATFDFPATGNPAAEAEIDALFPNTKGSADLELPTLIGFGIAYEFTEQLTAEFNWMQLGWSSYDELTIKFDDPVAGETESTAERKYEDSYSLRLGIDYKVNEDWSVRLGYIRDNKAVPDPHVEPSLPEGNRNLYSVGFGYNLTENIVVDGFYMLLDQEDRDITNSVENFNGEYTGLANLFGVNFEFGL